jgi:hypothetical protein
MGNILLDFIIMATIVAALSLFLIVINRIPLPQPIFKTLTVSTYYEGLDK